MNKNYVTLMREKGLKDPAIKERLESAGWKPEEVTSLFAEADDEFAPPPPPHSVSSSSEDSPKSQDPIAVVHRYTTIGIEYTIMFLALGIGAISLGALLHDYLNILAGNGQYNWGADMAGVAAIVSIPIFLFLYLRLRRAETSDPTVRADSSRRRGVQLALIVSFLWGIKSIVFYLYNLMHGMNNNYYDYSSGYDEMAKISNSEYQLLQFGHMAITLIIAGGIFAYYWIDEHKHKS